jgi:MFS family permease
MVWGLAAFAFTWAADRYGRKPLLVVVGLLGLLLNTSIAASPNFGTYAALHPLTAVAIGPSGAIAYVLSAEWTSPRDLSLLTLLLNSSFSLSSCLVAGLCALGLPWRTVQLLLGLLVAMPLLGLPFVPESPRYLLAKGRCAQAESVLRAALRRAGVAPPPLHVTLKPLTTARDSAVASAVSSVASAESSNHASYSSEPLTTARDSVVASAVSSNHASYSSGSVQAATVHADAHADDSQCGDASLPRSSPRGHSQLNSRNDRIFFKSNVNDITSTQAAFLPLS